MKVVGDFNKISDKLKAEIPVLKPGETKVFKALWGVPNPDPDRTEQEKNPMLFGKRQLATYFRIFDPYKTDSAGKEVGGYVDIGVVESWNNGQPQTFACFIPGMGQFQFSGKFELQGGKIKDEELFEVLWLSHERAGNPHRDKTVVPRFEMIDVAAASKSTLTKVDTLRSALNLLATIKEEDAREVMGALNQKRPKESSALMSALSEYAKNQPEKFLEAYKDPERENRAIIAQAIDAGFLLHHPITGNVTMDGTDLLQVPATSDVLGDIMKWVRIADNGEQVFELIKTKLGIVKTKRRKAEKETDELVGVGV
jgi:hypothetical protein